MFAVYPNFAVHLKYAALFDMIKKLFFLFCTCYSLCTLGQYTNVINSNRPGYSENPYSVGTGVYQFESNLFYQRAKASPIFDNPGAYGIGLHFRTSFFSDKLEFNFNTSIQNDIMSFTNVFESTYNKFGLGQFTLGAKYLVYEPKYNNKGKEIRSWNKRHSFDFSRWVPHVAPYVGVNVGAFVNPAHNKGSVSPKLGVLLLNEFSFKFNIVTNIFYDYIGTDFSEWSYIVTGTYFFGKEWSGFVEHQAKFDNFGSSGNIGGGLAYLYNRHIQFNTSLRASFQENGMGIYTSVGASYRIDRHIDKFIELDDFGNEIVNPDTKSYNKGFFGRLFDSIAGIFKKKDRVEIDKTDQEGNTVKEEVKVEAGTRTRKKSILGDIIKKDKKAKKKKTKETKKAIKKAKREAEKAAKNAERDKIKEEKRLLKEQERLDKELLKEQEKLRKEQEKLERQLKKEQEKLEKQRLKEEKKKKKEEERLQREIEKLEQSLKNEKKKD